MKKKKKPQKIEKKESFWTKKFRKKKKIEKKKSKEIHKKVMKKEILKKREEKPHKGFMTRFFSKKKKEKRAVEKTSKFQGEKALDEGTKKEESKQKTELVKQNSSGSLTAKFLEKKLERKKKEIDRKFAETVQKEGLESEEKSPVVKTVFSEVELKDQGEKKKKRRFSLKPLLKRKENEKIKKELIDSLTQKHKTLAEGKVKGPKGPKIKTVISEVELKQHPQKKVFGKGSPEQKKKKKEEKAKRKKAHIQKRKQSFRLYLYKAGIETDPTLIRRRLFNVSIFIVLLASLGVVYYHAAVIEGIDWAAIGLTMAGLWSVGFLASLFVMWIFLYVWVDLRIFKRRLELEEVLPNFLQLTAANIKAGMTIDRALWFAVRPNFGILAHEIEAVAKEVMGGEDLKDALVKFSQKYDSVVLSRSISLIIEGMESGGEIGDLLNKIAMNIEDQRILIKEIAANVNTYAIFITFSSIVAAPFLFALAGVLIQVFSQISSSLDLTDVSSAPIPINFAGGGIEFADFRIFALISLVVTAAFSAMIISMIRSGTIKKGARNIPIFIIVSLSLYGVASLIAGQVVNIFV